MPTTVISVRSKPPKVLMADPSFVYVGRRCAGWTESIWGNPFRVDRKIEGRETAEKVVVLFRAYLLGSLDRRMVQPYWPNTAARFDRMARGIPSLRGKTLGCWCGDFDGTGEPGFHCHALVLAELADALDRNLP